MHINLQPLVEGLSCSDDVPSPLVAARGLREGGVLAVRLGPAAARAAAPHLDVLVRGRARSLPVFVRGGRALVAAPVPPAAALVGGGGHAVELTYGAAGGALLSLRLEADPVPLQPLHGRVQEVLRLAFFRHGGRKWDREFKRCGDSATFHSAMP